MLETSLNIAVVGHTNAGKTSFLRTLLRNRELGAVSAMPSTTREVTCYTIEPSSDVRLKFLDTPGLEESTELYRYVMREVPERLKHDGPKQLEYALAQPHFVSRFDQEAKVLRQLLQSDAALVVIDTRANLLEKFLDELYLLKLAGIPLVLILNFSTNDRDVARWEQGLRSASIHNLVAFDNVHTPFSAEESLFEQLSSVMPRYKAVFGAELKNRAEARANRTREALYLLSNLLIDVATAALIADKSEEREVKAELQSRVTQAETACMRNVLAIFGFTPNDTRLEQLPMRDGYWHDDLFDTDTWQRFGISVAGATAGGGAIGAGIDVMTGGLSLGLGMVIGSAVGVAYQGTGSFGKKLKAKWQGKHWYSIEASVLQILLIRQLTLIKALSERGLAAEHPLVIDSYLELDTAQLLQRLEKIRHHSEWSTLFNKSVSDRLKKEQKTEEFQFMLEKMFE